MWAVLADFDGTIVMQDLAERALSKFGKPGWQRFNDLLAQGKINVNECVRREYGMMEVRSPEAVLEYLRPRYRIRTGFEKLLRDCQTRGVEFAIVSAGLDFCIRDTFEKAGIVLPRLICPPSHFTSAGAFRLDFPRVIHPSSRDFKEDAVSSYRDRGFRVGYVGDGAGDFNAAQAADRVFAIGGSALDKMCRERGIEHTPLRSFSPVLRNLDDRD